MRQPARRATAVRAVLTGLEKGAVAAPAANSGDASIALPHAEEADHGRISNTISISDRPPSVKDRAVLGHWEGDLIFVSNNSQIATSVGRYSNF
jgi:hypothetical protein